MDLHKNRNGLFNTCEDGLVELSQCASFDCRPIAYVDKHATGTGDGTSPENAYTDIQTAINNAPTKEIQIQGYGEGDTYPGEIVLVSCVYLKGVDDLWIDGKWLNDNGIKTYSTSINNTKLESINIKNCSNAGFYECANCIIIDCVAKDNGYEGGFYGCSGSILDGCLSENNAGGGIRSCDYSNLLNCTAFNNSASGFSYCNFSNITNCISNNHSVGYGFVHMTESIFVNCQSNTNSNGYRRNDNCSFIDCSSIANFWCGFINNYGSSFINCTTSGDCTKEGFECTPGNPSYNCDV